MRRTQTALSDFGDGAPPPATAAFQESEGRVRHPLLQGDFIEARPFQTRLAAKAVDASLLVVLPTGLGKTAIAVLAAAERLRREPGGKVLLLAPTRPLVHQHATFFRRALAVPGDAVVAVSGTLSPARRQAAFEAARVVVATPQTIANDVAAGRVDLAGVTLLVLDEAHRSVGNYAYVPVSQAYRDARGGAARVLGLTASPGSRRDRIHRVLDALGGPAVEVREREDEDVEPYVKPVHVEFAYVKLPPRMARARDQLESLLGERVHKLKGFIPRRNPGAKVGKGVLLETGEVIRKRLTKMRGPAKGYCFAAMLNQGVAMQAAHALEVLETQGLHPFADYVTRVAAKEKPSRAQKAFLNDVRVHRALHAARVAPVSHPKELALLDAVEEQMKRKPESLILVFAQYRDTVRRLTERLQRAGVSATRFVGQADRGENDPGLAQDAQQRALAAFEAGQVRALVATSVAEEGLHVPSVDLVVFYEPVPSEIRAIQRRGRTGRSAVGRVLVLVTDATRDEAFLRAQTEREAEMRRVVHGLRDTPAAVPAPPEEGDGEAVA